MTTSAVFPPKAAQALGFLKSAQDDVEIFVEDTSAPNMWVKLLRSYLPSGVKLRSVSVLGSRENVIGACRSDQAIDSRRKLYIIDGDLDILRGMGKPRLRHMYRLRAYCVENYLIHYVAFTEAITTMNPNVSLEDAARRFQWKEWLERNGQLLERLFVCYAVVYELAREEKTIGYSVHRLLRDGRGEYDLCERKVFARTSALYRLTRGKHSRQEVRAVYDKVRKNAAAGKVEEFVSAKDYILPPLFGILKLEFRKNERMDLFTMLLASNCTGAEDPYLRRRIQKLCEGLVG